MNNKKSQKGIHDLLLRFPGNLIAGENARAETLLLCLRFIWCVGYSDFQVQDETRFVVGHPTTSCPTPYPAAAKCETTLHDQEDIQRLCYVSTLKIQIRECSIVINTDCFQQALFPVPIAVDMNAFLTFSATLTRIILDACLNLRHLPSYICHLFFLITSTLPRWLCLGVGVSSNATVGLLITQTSLHGLCWFRRMEGCN
jgi:hypothetical protein